MWFPLTTINASQRDVQRGYRVESNALFRPSDTLWERKMNLDDPLKKGNRASLDAQHQGQKGYQKSFQKMLVPRLAHRAITAARFQL